MRKYEIHLPLNYINGKPIEREKIKRVRDELVAAFGSFAVPRRRTWRHDGANGLWIVKIEIITTRDKVTTKRFEDLKERLRESLQQVDILITTHSIQVI